MSAMVASHEEEHFMLPSPHLLALTFRPCLFYYVPWTLKAVDLTLFYTLCSVIIFLFQKTKCGSQTAASVSMLVVQMPCMICRVLKIHFQICNSKRQVQWESSSIMWLASFVCLFDSCPINSHLECSLCRYNPLQNLKAEYLANKWTQHFSQRQIILFSYFPW